MFSNYFKLVRPKHVVLVFVTFFYLYLYINNSEVISNVSHYIVSIGTSGKIAYLLLTVLLSTVIPINSAALWPFAYVTYGAIDAFVLTSSGSLIAGAINYFLLYKYGKTVVHKTMKSLDSGKVTLIGKRFKKSSYFLVGVLSILNYKYSTAALGYFKYRYHYFLFASAAFFIYLFVIFFSMDALFDI